MESEKMLEDTLVELDDLREAADEASALLKTLANPDRLLVMCELALGEKNVGELEQSLGIVQPTLSQQLAVLREARLVGTRREGKNIYYRVDSPPALAVLQVLHAQFCGPGQPKRRRR